MGFNEMKNIMNVPKGEITQKCKIKTFLKTFKTFKF